MESKICIRCKKEKAIDNFHLRKDNGKYRGKCKDCQKKYFANRYVSNIIKEKDNRKKHYEANKEDYIARSREWKKNNTR